MEDKLEFRVYISSTIDDLVEERAAARDVLSRNGAIVRDSYRASEKGSVATCTGDVRDAHLYVGIIGQRYGWIPDGEANLRAKSITELEYDACVQPGCPAIKRLIFIRTTNPNNYTDALKNKATAERIEKFLARAGSEQQPYLFDSVSKLREALGEAVRTKRDEFHREKAPGQPIFDQRKVWNSALKPVVLLSMPGTDDELRNALMQSQPSLFAHGEIRPTEGAFAFQADSALRKGQLACLMLSSASLQRATDPAVAASFDRLMATMRRRVGVAIVICVDFDPATLPAKWQPATRLAIAADTPRVSPKAAADEIYRQCGAVAAISPHTRLALPCLVIAPTRDEVEALAKGAAGFAGFKDAIVRKLRRQEFDRLSKSASAMNPKWPRGSYGVKREDWKCFGSGSHPMSKLIADVVGTINTAHPGSREKEMLHDAELLIRPYDLDEYLTDADGSRRVVEDVCARGCLLIIDEAALLHPRLRDAANVLLSARRSAVVAVSPCDPSQWPTARLLGDTSFLRVGAIVERFKTDQDFQCELALNSEERVRRWLRLAIPRLIVEIEGLASHPSLVSRIDEQLQ